MSFDFSSAPFGRLTADLMFSAAELGLASSSTQWEAVAAFTKVSEGVVERLTDGPNGTVLMVGVPGRQNTGAFYLYEKTTQTFYSLNFEAQDTFSQRSFESILELYGISALIHHSADVQLPENSDKQRSRNYWQRRTRSKARQRGAAGQQQGIENQGVSRA